MDSSRRCTKSSCERPAVATLTYSYQDSTIVVGPMSVYSEPHTYDLCAECAANINPPRGWEVLRLEYPATPKREEDDLLALADAVQQSRGASSAQVRTGTDSAAEPGSLPRRESRGRIEPPTPEAALTKGHLRLLKD